MRSIKPHRKKVKHFGEFFTFLLATLSKVAFLLSKEWGVSKHDRKFLYHIDLPANSFMVNTALTSIQ
jgi:hypothetical protein